MEKFTVYLVDDNPPAALIELMASAGAEVTSVTRKERAAQSGPDAGYRTADLVLVGSNNPDEIGRGVRAMNPSGPFDLIPRVITYINTEKEPDFPEFLEESLAEHHKAVLQQGVEDHDLAVLLGPQHSPLLPIIRREEPVHVVFVGESSPELHAQHQRIAECQGATHEDLGSASVSGLRVLRLIRPRQLVVMASCPNASADGLRIANLASVRPGGVPKRQVIIYGPENMRSFCGSSGMFCTPDRSTEVLQQLLEDMGAQAAA